MFMNKLLLTRNVLAMVMCSTLIACGGGGGGSGGNDSPKESGNAADAYAAEFNEYLPLTDEGSITYNDTSNGLLSSVQNLSTEFSTSSFDVYNILFTPVGNSNINVGFNFSSTPDAIQLHAITGPIDLSILYLHSLTLEAPITIYNGSDDMSVTDQETTATALISLDSDADGTKIKDIAVTYSITTTPVNYYFGFKQLPVIAVEITTHIVRNNILVIIDIDEEFSTTLYFAKGIGILRHDGFYGGLSFASELYSINNLPLPIWFDYNATSETISLNSDSSSTFSTLTTGPISSDNYSISNMEEINALGWVSVQESGSTYTIDVTDIPTDETLPYSLEVVFEDSSGTRMSGNVTIQEAP